MGLLQEHDEIALLLAGQAFRKWAINKILPISLLKKKKKSSNPTPELGVPAYTYDLSTWDVKDLEFKVVFGYLESSSAAWAT